VVVSLGNRRDSSALGTLPGDPIIVRNAPQLELLKKASVVVTHAGPNTVLESLLEGKPMLALPIALDQPAVAAHVARLGAAEVLAPHKCSSTNIRLALTKLITDSQYRSSAQRIQEQLKRLHGTSLAAEIIEESLVDWNYRASSRWK
jgi:MGT family glycosyltransferase